MIWRGMLNIVVHISRSSVGMILEAEMMMRMMCWCWHRAHCEPECPHHQEVHTTAGDVLIPAAGPSWTIDHRQGRHPAPTTLGSCGRPCSTQWWRGNLFQWKRGLDIPLFQCVRSISTKTKQNAALLLVSTTRPGLCEDVVQHGATTASPHIALTMKVEKIFTKGKHLWQYVSVMLISTFISKILFIVST